MDKKKLLAGAAGVAMVTLSVGVNPQLAEAAKGTGTIHAELLTPIVFTQSANLDFGTFAQDTPTQAGTVAITVGGTVTNTKITQIAASTPNKGVFKISSIALTRPFTISAPATAKITAGGTQTMTVTGFAVNCGSKLSGVGTAQTQVCSATAASGTFPVGANLVIPGGQAAGVYTGSFTVNINYN